MDIDKTKKCRDCNLEKPLSDFRVRKNGYYISYCRKCEVIRTNNRNRENFKSLNTGYKVYTKRENL